MTAYRTVLTIDGRKFELAVGDLPDETWTVHFRQEDIPYTLQALTAHQFCTSAQARGAVQEAALALEGTWERWEKV